MPKPVVVLIGAQRLAWVYWPLYIPKGLGSCMMGPRDLNPKHKFQNSKPLCGFDTMLSPDKDRRNPAALCLNHGRGP